MKGSHAVLGFGLGSVPAHVPPGADGVVDVVGEEGPEETCTAAGVIRMTGQSSSARKIHAVVNAAAAAAAVDGTCLGYIDPGPDPDLPGPERSSFSGMELGLAHASGQEDVSALDAEEEEARSCGASGPAQAEAGTH